MEILFILLALLAFVAGGNYNCGDNHEWDEVLKTCVICQYGTVYNKYTRKCLTISGKGLDCMKGFQFDFVEGKCVDIDECNQGKYQCQTTEYCVNIDGGYQCKQDEYCGQGYKFSNVTKKCEDINECELKIDNCGSKMICNNVPGSFNCRQHCPEDRKYYYRNWCNVCQEGFQFNDKSQTCEDIDECEAPFKLACQPFKEKCVKKAGLSECVHHCSGGTLEENGQCNDIDECATKTHNCSTNQMCQNLFGSFQCVNPKCDFNTEFKADLNSCECKSGFKWDPVSYQCEDMDECQTVPTPCGVHGRCENSRGSYNCVCNTGYSSHNGTCEDINECSVMRGVCGSLRCENIAGSYRCMCPPGFRANEYDLCEDIDECTERPDVCSVDNMLLDDKYQCFNLIGSYKCRKVECPAEYRTVIEGRSVTCELVNENCSAVNNELCVQTLPEKILMHIIEIPRAVTVPYKVAIINLDVVTFDHYHMEVVVRKALDLESKRPVDLGNVFMLTHDEDERNASLYIVRPLASPMEIVCEVYFKYTVDSQQRSHSLNKYYIFASNDTL